MSTCLLGPLVGSTSVWLSMIGGLTNYVVDDEDQVFVQLNRRTPISVHENMHLSAPVCRWHGMCRRLVSLVVVVWPAGMNGWMVYVQTKQKVKVRVLRQQTSILSKQAQTNN